MSATKLLKDRRLIPKWRPVKQTLATPEAQSVSSSTAQPSKGDPEQLQRDIEDWRENPGVGFLGAVLAHSVHPDLNEEVSVIAREALTTGSSMSPIQREAVLAMLQSASEGGDGKLGESPLLERSAPTQSATDSLSSDGYTSLGASRLDYTSPEYANLEYANPAENHQGAAVRRLRELLRENNDNPLAWLDLAQFQAAAGKDQAAHRSIQTALQLSPNNRTVLRTAARFYVHIGEERRGHRLISAHARTATDPWLMATEIALADLANTGSKFLKLGSRIVLEGNQFAPVHISELSGAVASQQLKEGSLKKARKSQLMALKKPNDNVMAQAVFQQHEFGVALDGPGLGQAILGSNEALVFQHWANAEAQGAEIQARNWHTQEPFSSRPVQLLALLNIYKADYMRAHQWLMLGLRSDANADELINNMGYVKARLGKFEEANQLLQKAVRLEPKNEPQAKATQGMMCYMRRDFAAGDHLYVQAMEQFAKNNDPYVMAYCSLFMAMHATEYDHPLAEQHVAMANDLIKRFPSPDTNIFLKQRNSERMVQPVDLIASEPRNLQQLIYDERTNVLTIKHGVQSRGTDLFIRR